MPYVCKKNTVNVIDRHLPVIFDLTKTILLINLRPSRFFLHALHTMFIWVTVFFSFISFLFTFQKFFWSDWFRDVLNKSEFEMFRFIAYDINNCSEIPLSRHTLCFISEINEPYFFCRNLIGKWKKKLLRRKTTKKIDTCYPCNF